MKKNLKAQCIIVLLLISQVLLFACKNNEAVSNNGVEKTAIGNDIVNETEEIQETYSLTKDDYDRLDNHSITLLGDTIPYSTKDFIEGSLNINSIWANPEFGTSKILNVYETLRQEEKLSDIVIVACGSNPICDFNIKDIEKIYSELDGRLLVLVTPTMIYKGQERMRNKALKNFVKNNSANCILVDFSKEVKMTPELLNEDKNALTKDGRDRYISLIKDTLANSYKENLK